MVDITGEGCSGGASGEDNGYQYTRADRSVVERAGVDFWGGRVDVWLGRRRTGQQQHRAAQPTPDADDQDALRPPACFAHHPGRGLGACRPHHHRVHTCRLDLEYPRLPRPCYSNIAIAPRNSHLAAAMTSPQQQDVGSSPAHEPRLDAGNKHQDHCAHTFFFCPPPAFNRC